KGLAAPASHPGLEEIVSRTVALIVISTIASTTRSERAVVNTNILLIPNRRLIKTVRITSPAGAGRTLFPRSPAEVAQNACGIGTFRSELSNTLQRTARRNNAVERLVRASNTNP